MAYATINKPDTYFNTKLYTGNNNVTQTISGVGFQPDFTWIKCRTDAEYHHLADVVRGANKFLHSNVGDAERTGSRASGYNTMAFTSDGFSLTNPTAQNDELNFGSRTYVSWNWKANGAGVSNTQGSITSTVSANTTSGFSIVKWTGTGATGTIGHGLGIAPKLLILKDTSNAYNWYVYTSATGSNVRFEGLNNANASTSATSEFTTTSTLITNVTNAPSQNTSGANMLLYCFAEVKGFSKIGSYTGNGSTDGTFVYTGFKPSWVLIKRKDNAGNWILKDNKRDTYNFAKQTLLPNSSGAEYDDSAYNRLDFLSNGFKLRGGGSGVGNDTNASEQYIYAAFAEQPLVGTNNVPATAR